PWQGYALPLSYARFPSVGVIYKHCTPAARGNVQKTSKLFRSIMAHHLAPNTPAGGIRPHQGAD
ncbi:MAG: hypothetical protein KKC72_18935, partial [Alphaproteobacteria bacterium]|nr:hypothetical protein [Alphaproteobacteria bacterium]MBU1837899.1 hypothetical protein [Alphaproteobacteria bacterium]